MTWAADAAGNPDPAALAATGCAFIGRYLATPFQRYGVTRAYVDACHERGVGVLLIAEEWGSQFLGGAPAATAAAGRALAAWDQLGAPRDGTVTPAVVLVDPSPGLVPGNEPALRAFAAAWDAELVAAGFRAWTGYGSRYGLEISSQVAPHMTRRWGVGTWGYGERSDGSLPADVGAHLIQHGNRAAPVAGCDFNTILSPDMGQWGGTTPARTEEVPDMYVYRGQTIYGVPLGGVAAGDRVLLSLDGPDAAYGLSQGILDWKNGPGRDAVPVVFLDPVSLAALVQPPATPNPGGSATVDLDRLADLLSVKLLDRAAQRLTA